MTSTKNELLSVSENLNLQVDILQKQGARISYLEENRRVKADTRPANHGGERCWYNCGDPSHFRRECHALRRNTKTPLNNSTEPENH